MKRISRILLVAAAVLAPLAARADVVMADVVTPLLLPSFHDIVESIGVHRLAIIFFLVVFALGVFWNLSQRHSEGNNPLRYCEIAVAAIINGYFWALVCVSETWQIALAMFLIVSVPFLAGCLLLTRIMRKALRRPAMAPSVKTEVMLVYIAMEILFFALSLLLAYAIK